MQGDERDERVRLLVRVPRRSVLLVSSNSQIAAGEGESEHASSSV